MLRRAVAQLWPGDAVMTDFVNYVVTPLSTHLGTEAAKGGEFVNERVEAGLVAEERYRYDQSFRAHLVNGLLPVLNIARILSQWQAPRMGLLDDRARRVFISGYVLHDWLKFRDVQEELRSQGLSHDTVNVVQHLHLVEAWFARWGHRLGLDGFLAPIGGFQHVLHDLIYVAANTQVKWGTMLNPSGLPRLSLDGRTRELCISLGRLADLLAYVARTPREVVSLGAIRAELAGLSNNTAQLVYHHVADNRGILTNIIQNAALLAVSHSLRVPFLYAPSGVVYLAHKDAPPLPSVTEVMDKTIETVRTVAGSRLATSLTGFKRDGKGLKRADYYDLFFDLSAQVRIGADATFKEIPPSKAPVAAKRYAKMRGWMDEGVDLVLPDDVRVDQLAEWCYFAETSAGAARVDFGVADFLLKELGLADLHVDFMAVPRDNRAGGVGYHWYFAAGHYLKRNPGKDPTEWEQLIKHLAGELANIIATRQTAQATTNDSWGELRDYIGEVFSTGPTQSGNGADRSLFTRELARYQNAKRSGRGRSAVCSLCSSPFDVVKQQEAAVLFRPQVYSNKLLLHGANAIRDICPICGLEMMLRQILMNRSRASGRWFEGRNIRYLYFYPTYFFSPETLQVFRDVQNRLSGISFTELRRQVTMSNGQDGEERLRLDADILQRLEPLLLQVEDLSASDTDQFLRVRFPKNDPVTFFFLGIPPRSRDATDAESWVLPAFLALLLPVCVDVKVVASASPLPLLKEAGEMPETVFLDGAHPFVRAILGASRINVDQVLPELQKLVVAYLVHMDANSGLVRGRWDYQWSHIPPLARDLASDPAYVCFYLKQWQRNAGADSIPIVKARQYREYTRYLGEGGATMSHARTLLELSREFYRAGRYNSNSILRPISVVSGAILDADPRLFDRQGLVEAARGALSAFMERVQTGSADGRFPPGSNRERREDAMQRFAEHFAGIIYYDTLRGDAAALRGKQLNLLKNAYEVLYMEAEGRARRDKQTADQEPEEAATSEQ